MTNLSRSLAKLGAEERATIFADMIEKMARERALEIAGRLLNLHPELVSSYFYSDRVRRSFAPGEGDAVVPECSPDRIRTIRRATASSPKDFEAMFGIPARTLEGWEQGRRKPDPVAKILLQVIASDPRAVRNAVTGRETIPPNAVD